MQLQRGGSSVEATEEQGTTSLQRLNLPTMMIKPTGIAGGSKQYRRPGHCASSVSRSTHSYRRGRQGYRPRGCPNEEGTGGVAAPSEARG